MAKKSRHQGDRPGENNLGQTPQPYWPWLLGAAVIAAGIVAVVQNARPPQTAPAISIASMAAATAHLTALTNFPAQTNAPLASMEINQAVMVTVELDFGPTVPSIAEALREIERRYQPEDGAGRTFAILDAYGETTPGGKLHLSMHLSTEKTGVGALVFRRTGEVLWRSKIVPTTNQAAATFNGKNLMIFVDNGAGKMLTIDGSSNPSSILEASAKEPGMPVHTIWPDGATREMTFIYSACGCPVKVMVQRVGDRTVRTKELPVIFPDDSSAVEVINHLMRW